MNTINIIYDILKNDLNMPGARARQFAEALQEIAKENTGFKSAVKDDF